MDLKSNEVTVACGCKGHYCTFQAILSPWSVLLLIAIIAGWDLITFLPWQLARLLLKPWGLILSEESSDQIQISSSKSFIWNVWCFQQSGLIFKSESYQRQWQQPMLFLFLEGLLDSPNQQLKSRFHVPGTGFLLGSVYSFRGSIITPTDVTLLKWYISLCVHTQTCAHTQAHIHIHTKSNFKVLLKYDFPYWFSKYL